jgi:hypothetical protein
MYPPSGPFSANGEHLALVASCIWRSELPAAHGKHVPSQPWQTSRALRLGNRMMQPTRDPGLLLQGLIVNRRADKPAVQEPQRQDTHHRCHQPFLRMRQYCDRKGCHWSVCD